MKNHCTCLWMHYPRFWLGQYIPHTRAIIFPYCPLSHAYLFNLKKIIIVIIIIIIIIIC